MDVKIAHLFISSPLFDSTWPESLERFRRYMDQSHSDDAPVVIAAPPTPVDQVVQHTASLMTGYIASLGDQAPPINLKWAAPLVLGGDDCSLQTREDHFPGSAGRTLTVRIVAKEAFRAYRGAAWEKIFRDLLRLLTGLPSLPDDVVMYDALARLSYRDPAGQQPDYNCLGVVHHRRGKTVTTYAPILAPEPA